MHMYRLPAALFIWALCHIGSVNGYVRPRDDTPTGVDSASSAIVTPAFQFDKISEMTTCQPAVISWMYSPVTVDDPLVLTLNITNDGVLQPSPPSATATGTFATPNVGRAWNRRDLLPLTQQITTDSGINPLERTYTWPSVNVSAGWYELTATLGLPGFLQTSTSFYVQNGTDVSCLASQPASSSSTPSNPSSTGSPTSTGAAETSGVTLPVSSSSGSSKVNRGAIAGGVIGGLAVIAAAIAAYFYLRYASASSASKGSPNRAQRKWAGLGSTDTKAKVYPPASRSAGVSSSGRHHSQSDSIGPMLSSRDSNVYVIGNVGIDSRPSRINDALEEQDEVNSYFSPSQEKISSTSAGRSPFSDSNHGHADAVPLDYIPSAAAVTRNSSTSTSSYMNNFSRPRSDPSSPYASPDDSGGAVQRQRAAEHLLFLDRGVRLVLVSAHTEPRLPLGHIAGDLRTARLRRGVGCRWAPDKAHAAQARAAVQPHRPRARVPAPADPVAAADRT
ncbi:hypothetical protein MVEN_01378200 [Mycena venus]|uniref:Uncharacterized protein n=1 Tax=Mycena venus TaxID=2733690 RepID=A0A8H6XYC5_9AGAR|nr:hypothetical protein MVEN_01378200 [Mycena venus]